MKTEIIKYKNEHSHSVYASIIFMGGSNACDNPNSGLAHLVEHMLFRACGELSQEEFYKETARHGITINASTCDSHLEVNFRCLPEKLPVAVQLVSGMLTAEWDKNMLAFEKQVIIAETYNPSSSYVTKLKNKYLNALSTKSNLGTKTSVSRFTLKKALEARKKVLGGKRYFIIAGNFNEADYAPLIDVLDGFEDHVREIKHSATKYEKVSIKTHDYNYVSVTFVFNKRDVSYERLVMLKSILFEGLESPVQYSLREQKGYTYSVDTEIWYLGEKGLLNIYYEVEDTENILPSLVELISIIVNREKHVTEDNLKLSKPFHTTNLNFLYDDNRALVEECEYSLTNLGIIFDIKSEKRKFESVTLLDVIDTAKTVLNEDSVAIEIGCVNAQKLKRSMALIKDKI